MEYTNGLLLIIVGLWPRYIDLKEFMARDKIFMLVRHRNCLVMIYPNLKSHKAMVKVHNFIPSRNFFVSFLLVWANLGMITTLNITTDQYALLALKTHITSETNQILERNWSLASSVCEWIGVTCGSRHRRVTTLIISNMGLTGTIPPPLGNLSFLVTLDITGNNFHAELPHELSRLQRLRVLNFSFNNLTGEIPLWLGSLHKLEFLSLRNNSFTGSIPTSISNLSNLEHLRLSFNSLQGRIPIGIGNLYNLKTLVMESNQISGSLPSEIFNISSLETIALMSNSLSGSLPMFMCHHRPSKLKWLNLSRNKLNGQIPSSLFRCSELQMLSLSLNHFDGLIPKEIGNLKMLGELYLGDNNLKGEIPPDIGNATALKILSFRYNNFSGVLPKELGNLYNLEELYLQNNSLSCSIPVEIFNLSTIRLISVSTNNLSGNLPSSMGYGLPNLEQLYLQMNNLDGGLPESISNCSKLNEISISTNKLSGWIPNSLGNLRHLEWLDVANNYLSSHSSSPELVFITNLMNCKHLRVLQVQNNPLYGILPESIGNLSSSLERAYAYNCNIKGKIPQGLGNLTGLVVLSLKENQLTGSIPSSFINLQQLQALGLRDNKINRAILDNFCGLQKLGLLSLGQNLISESIPECFGNITSLRYLHLDSNRLTSSIPTNLWNLEYLLDLNLSSNSLVGFLPPEVENLNVVTMIDLSVNNLSGDIPPTIGRLENLNDFSLAFNRFQGSIPESMGKMISIETLDLSHNNLSGMIPMSLETLQYLKHFNVSFNDLSGEIPARGPFKNFTSESFLSNKALCGAAKFHVPPCPKLSTHDKMKSKRVRKVIIIFVCLAAVVSAMAFGFIYIRYLKTEKVPSAIDLSSAIIKERITYYELLQATDGFSESNLLGIGSFGSVYKGIIDGGMTVAVKVFNLQLQEGFKSFDVECEVLRNLRHRNLTKVINSCSNPDFKALVLEFMPNGSLDKWLYSHNNFLDIVQRLDIMIDVACALEYLHSGYLTPVVHCDLKPSNILLDQAMAAHVCDFGISKLLGREDSITYTKTLPTFGYAAPEYGLQGLVSTKCDMYSFGIVLMEVFTRTKPSNEMFRGNSSLRSWVDDCMPNALAQVIDANLLRANEEYIASKVECISAIMEVALNCSKESPRERSNIGDVVVTLKKIKLRLLSHQKRE